MKLFCVRHGETFHNLEGRIQGQTNSRLSPLGQRQCEAVADRLAAQSIDAIVSSPLERAIDSAQVVADKVGVTLATDPRLMEINAGIFQGLTWSEINDRYAAEAARWKTQDPDFRIPQGESRRDVMLRAGPRLTRSVAGHRPVVVLAHGGSLSAGLESLLGIPPQRNPFTLANGSISTLIWESEVRLFVQRGRTCMG